MSVLAIFLLFVSPSMTIDVLLFICTTLPLNQIAVQMAVQKLEWVTNSEEVKTSLTLVHRPRLSSPHGLLLRRSRCLPFGCRPSDRGVRPEYISSYKRLKVPKDWIYKLIWSYNAYWDEINKVPWKFSLSKIVQTFSEGKTFFKQIPIPNLLTKKFRSSPELRFQLFIASPVYLTLEEINHSLIIIYFKRKLQFQKLPFFFFNLAIISKENQYLSNYIFTPGFCVSDHGDQSRSA